MLRPLPHRPSATFVFSCVLLAALVCAPPSSAQEAAGGWWLEVGGGVGVEGLGHDRSDDGGAAGVATASLESLLGRSGLRVGVEWRGAWLAGAFGGEQRQHLGVTASIRPGDGPLSLRAGAGLGLATVVDVSDPPVAPAAGDQDVGIGEHATVDLTLGFAFDLPLAAGVEFGPSADLLVQRGGGHTFALGLVGGHLRFRFGSR